MPGLSPNLGGEPDLHHRKRFHNARHLPASNDEKRTCLESVPKAQSLEAPAER